MNTPVKAGLALVAVAALWTGATAICAQRVKAALTAQLDEMPLRPSKVSYEGGLFGATRTLELDLGCAGQQGVAKPAHIVWREHIQYGPFPGMRAVGAARIEGEIVLGDAQRAELKQATGLDGLPMRALSLVGFSGASDTRFSIGALEVTDPKTDTQLVFQGLEARVRKSRDGSLHYEGSMPRYELKSARSGFNMLMAGAEFSGEGLAPYGLLATGKSSGSLKTLSVHAPGPDGQPRMVFALEGLSYDSEGRLDQQLYSAHMQMSGKGHAGDKAIDAFGFKASMQRVDMGAYMQALKSMMARDCERGAQTPQQQLDEMTRPLLKMLVANPSFSVDELKLTIEGQTASLHYSLGAEGMTAEDVQGPALMPALMQKGQFRMGATVPVGFVQNMVTASGRALPPEALDEQIAKSVRMGMVRRDGDVLSSELEFKAGVMQLNGQVMPMGGSRPPAAPAGQ